MRLFEPIDKLLIRILKINSTREAAFHEKRSALFGMGWAKKIDGILHDMSILDSKSSALLTHISVILVVLSFSLDGSSTKYINGILVFEMAMYTVTAMFLLRCVDIMGPPYKDLPESDNEAYEKYYIEIRLRREIYTRALRTAFVLTAILVPTFILKYLALS